MLALLVSAASFGGLPTLEQAEARTTDLLFRYGRPEPPEPSPDIVHVDIDDGSLDTIGRWPWPRRLLAESIAALDRFGARVIAIDILLSEPQAPEYAADGSLVDHDGLLAATLDATRARVILAVSLEDVRTQLGPLWQDAAGEAKWRALQELLRGDITLRADDLIRRLGLDTDRAARVRDRLREMKRVAIREVAARLAAKGDLTIGKLREELLPAGSADLGDFPEMALIRNEAMRAEAAAVFEEGLPAAREGVAYERADWVVTPLPAFARAVHGAGVVSATPDPDGHMRRVVVRWEKSGKAYPQLGAAAAAAWLGVPIDAVESGPEATMILAWPRIDPVRHALGFARHIPLGLVLEISKREEELEALRRAQEPLTRELVGKYLPDEARPEDLDDPGRRPAVLLALHEQVEFLLQGGDAPGAEKESIAARNWLRQQGEIDWATKELTPARRRLEASLEGKLVLVGWNAEGNFGDFFPTVAHQRTPGVVAHGIVANSFLTGYFVTPASRGVAALVTLALGLLTALATARPGPRLAFLVALLFAVVYVAANTLFVFNRMRVALAMAAPLAAIVAAWAGTAVMRAVKERRERRQLERQFGARISRQLLDFLLEHPDQVDLEGREREVTCFFSDLAGFTSISESLDSRTTVSLLNKYMWEMNDELTKLDAYVNKFLGDGIMAVWGAFAVDPRHAEQACRAALGCLARLERFNEQPEFRGLPRLSMRIGIATGVVTVGDCGAPPDLRDYTVIGDSANLAARLESANKQFGTRILVNGRTKEMLTDAILTRPLGRITVVGQQAPTEIHEVLAIRGQETAEQRTLAERTERAVGLVAEGRIDDARAAWEALLPSRLAELYLAQLADADEAFDGVLHLASK